MQKLTGLLKWIDDNIVKTLAVIFIYLIPLYPKFPLVGFNDTYIAVRVEDFFMVIFVVTFFVQWLRKKITLNTPLMYLFIAYWVAQFLSVIVGFYFEKEFTFQYLGFLHAARRVEYMVIFFMIASLIKTKDDFYFYLKHVLIAALIVLIYGLGQKFIGLPAVSTMNKEFAKGMVLFLRAADRVSSTFAGHYDLAAYIVFLIPIMLGYHMNKKQHWAFIAYILAVAILMLTASRSSFGAYLIATVLFLIFTRRFGYLIVVAVITTIFLFTFDSLSQRFADTFRLRQVFVNENTGEVLVTNDLTTGELPSGTAIATAEGQTISTEEQKEEQERLRKQILDEIKRDAEAKGKELTEEQIAVELERLVSGFKPVVSYTSDISFSNRLLVSWPRSVMSFQKNVMFGTGPSSLGEATDGSFFRWIGESGLLGTTLLLSIFSALVIMVWTAARKLAREESALFYGFIFGLFGLAINGTYIDVFEASKVAFTLWLVAGIFVAAIPLFTKKHTEKQGAHTGKKKDTK